MLRLAFALFGVGRVEYGEHGLLDLGAGEVFGRGGQAVHVEAGLVAASLADANRKDCLALFRAGQIDEKVTDM